MYARNIASIDDHEINSMPLSREIYQNLREPPRNILIIGGLGRIGKILSADLIRMGYYVIILDVSRNVQELFDELKYQAVDQNQVNVFHDDMRNDSILHTIHKEHRELLGIIHLAGISRDDWCQENAEDCFRINVRNTELFLQAMRSLSNIHAEKPWLIYLSSNFVYKSQAAFASNYIRSRIEAENIIKTFCYLFSRTTILRTSEIYGMFDDYPDRTIPYFVRQALANNPISLLEPDIVRHYIHIFDVIRVCITLIKNTASEGAFLRKPWISTFSVTGYAIDRRSLLSIVLKITNSQSLVRMIGIDQSLPSNHGITFDELKHRPNYNNIYEGLQEYVNDIRKRDLYAAKTVFNSECSKNVIEQTDLHMCTMLIYTDVLTRTKLSCAHSDTLETINGKLSPEFRFISANVKKIRGMSGYYIQCLPSNSDFLTVVNKAVTKSHNKSVFFISYSPEYRSAALLIHSDEDINNLFLVQPNGSLELWDGYKHLYFLSPYCCEGKTPLPLLRMDPLLQKRKELSWHNKSARINTKCRRLKAYINQDRVPIDNTSYTSMVEFNKRWSQYVAPNRSLCDRDCSLFTGCLLFDNCRCVPDRCSAKSQYVYHLLSYSRTSEFVSQYKSRAINDTTIAHIPFEATLQHHSRAFFKSFVLPRIHVLEVPWEFLPYYNDTNRYKRQKKHCFIADEVILRELKKISTNISQAEFVVVPFFHGFYFHYKKMSYVKQVSLIKKLEKFVHATLLAAHSTARIVLPLSHDSGGCIRFAWDQMDLVLSSSNDQMSSLRRAYLLQPNGDYNTNCYYPNKDIVIPPFTCQTPELVTAFRDLRKVKNILDRRVFAFFKGTLWGSGVLTRARLSCPQIWPKTWNQTSHGILCMQKYFNHSDYLTTLNETKFCLLVPGTAGWSPRLIDAVYAGCIPVFITSSTHNPFEEILDYEKFSVFLPENDVDILEEKLLSFTDSDLMVKQGYLLKVRTAFIFQNSDHRVERSSDRYDPLFFILLSLRMRLDLRPI